jgi:hypothetical protein
MRKKLYLVFVFAMALSLLIAPAAFAQEDDQTTAAVEEDLVRVEVRNRTDQTVFIVLTTAFLPQGAAGEDGQATAGESPFTGDVRTETARMVEDVGTESGRTRFFGLAVGPETERTFTVERGVYFHRTTACGVTQDGVIDVTSQIRLVFVPCGSEPANAGAPSMEKISMDDPDLGGVNWRYQLQ